MSVIIQSIAVFFAYIILDFVFARYNMACADKHAVRAAFWAGVIPLFSGAVAIMYVSNPWLLIPTALGGVVGTYLSVWMSNRGPAKSDQ